MGLNLKAPDHTTLSRRNQIVAVPPLTRSYDGPIDLIVDSTGLKILGCGRMERAQAQGIKETPGLAEAAAQSTRTRSKAISASSSAA